MLQLILFDNSAHAFSHKIIESVLFTIHMQFQLFFFFAFMLFRHFFKRILFFSHWKYPLCIKLDISVETVFFNLFFFRSLKMMITKNPRPKQAREIWSTSIWPPATRQNQHMNQSQFWPCRLSNRFQEYLTLWALESLCPICQGKIMDSVQAKKNAHFLAANFHHR